MAKYQKDGMLDAALNYIKDNATLLCFCTASIDSTTTYAKATNDPSTSSGFCLAKTASSITVGSPANGSVNGRKVNIPQQTDLTVLGSGANSGARLVIVGTDPDASSANTVLYITDTATQSVTGGNLVTLPSFNIEFSDAT